MKTCSIACKVSYSFYSCIILSVALATLQTVQVSNASPVTGDMCHITYVDSIALDQLTHPRSLT